MRHLKPLFFEHSKIPVWLSKVSPIEIEAITLFCFVFSRGEAEERLRRHETIHFQQYLETFVIGFLLIYLFEFLYLAIIKRMGFTKEAYRAIRFEQEAYDCDEYDNYLECRNRYAWKSVYKLGGE